ncbi:hypothetical protein C8F04DRAFT_1130483 [Mycena alexandri]|uniref:Uncharacterized protein n=1 Tax=Mycena alexandri TaxID=1745969 RepID=A0AAD6WTH3_9AGAR|nr:hypothetical protein C8F04DRAFT_1130483 [Mycena alexandri]
MRFPITGTRGMIGEVCRLISGVTCFTPFVFPPSACQWGIKSFKFRDRGTNSSPPSIGGTSTRRKTFGMSSLLGRRAKGQSPPLLDALIINEKLLAVEPSASENLDPGMRTKNPSRRVTEPVPATGAEAKDAPPKSIFRKLTTKFNRNQPSASPPAPHRRTNSIGVPQVNPSTTLATREARNAALRERGLLPPLPLSVQEAQQDMRIAIVSSPEPGEKSELERHPTAANRIKAEWEAKNRERLTEFRFGGNSPASSPMQEDFGLEAVREVDTPLPSPLPSPDGQVPVSDFGERVDDPGMKAPRAPPPTLNLSRGQHISPPLMQAWSDMPPDSYLPPLPGSATESNYSSLISAFSTTPPADAGFTPTPPTFLPLPPTPSLPNAAIQTPASGDVTPKPPGSPMTDGSHAQPSRSPSIPRLDPSESESSLGVPSLMQDSESVTTSESFASFGRMRNVPLATKVRNSTIEPQGHHAISVIVESPGEERDAFIAGPVGEDDDNLTQVAGKTPQVSEDILLAQAPPRRATEPATEALADADRRKSINVFKRGKGEGLSTMMSIRRTMGLGRAKSSAGHSTKVNVAKLPPSPTLSGSFASQQQNAQARGRPSPSTSTQRRLSVSPTMHNQGSILHEMSKIENEESRRMTEVAFM